MGSAVALVPRKYRLIAVLLLAVAFIAIDRAGCTGYQGDPVAKYDQRTFTVSRVLDGDTIDVEQGKEKSRVRLLGIDAPEMNYDSADGAAYGAAEATDYLKQRLDGQQVTLKLNSPEEKDKYGRLLAYVYAAGNANINLEMIEKGYVYADRRHDHALRKQFEQAEATAERRKAGLWKEVTKQQMPEWRQRWVEKKW